MFKLKLAHMQGAKTAILNLLTYYLSCLLFSCSCSEYFRARARLRARWRTDSNLELLAQKKSAILSILKYVRIADFCSNAANGQVFTQTRSLSQTSVE